MHGSGSTPPETPAWRTSLFPDAGSGAFVLPVKKAVREAEGLYAGGTGEFTLELID